MPSALPDVPASELSAIIRALRARPRPNRHARPAAVAFAAILVIFLHGATVAAWNPSQASSGAQEENQMRSLRQIAVVSSLALASGAAAQQAVQWRVEDGGNGHWYRRLSDTGSVPPSPSALGELAASLGGYLVSYHSAAEEQFVLSSLGPSMVGLFSTAGASSFQWASGESVSYTNWGCCGCNAGPYPNNSSSTARLVFQAAYPGCSGTQGFGPPWDDYPPSDWAGGIARNLVIIEWSADCNNDGIVDYGQILRYQLVDDDLNNIPDCCESKAGCTSEPVQWRVEEGGNGHWYAFTDDYARWPDARAQAQASGGDLATITSAAENGFLSSAFAGRRFWLGGRRSQSNFSVFEWVSGEPWSYSSWIPGEPNTCNPCGEALFIMCGNGLWDDTGLVVNATPDHAGFLGLVEWSSDCNNDGIVDYGQIRAGQLADANGNNIPDGCETIVVPTNFATVQAAIDSVPVGSQRVISVLAGTYNQSFSLNGKNIIIRGAADGTTIFDGTGLPASIATLTGGEPATAGLENLVFRNGTEGSIIYKGALFKVGGAVYGRDSSAFIRNCRFEGNRSDYGGGAYLLYCNMMIEDCVFASNTGIAQGGGLMVFGTTGVVRNCTFTGNQCGLAGIGGGSAFKAAGTLLTGETVLFEGCTVTGNTSGVEGGAVEFYENVELNPGTLRIVGSTITGNRSGTGLLAGAGGLMVTGRMQSCIVDDGTVLCDNLPQNVEGAFFIAGSVTICDCLADLNGDGVVSGGDLGLLLNAWGPTAPSGAGDVNHDGLVDGADLALMLNSWGFCQ